MEIIIGADLVPTESNLDLFKKGEVRELMGDKLLSLWSNTDFRIFNLETPLVDKETPIDKCGPNLITSSNAINGIKNLDPSLITLANNHILDQGAKGLKTTEKILIDNNIPYIGAGDNLLKAFKPFILEKNNKKIGLYACAEQEFTIATEHTPGANPFDPLESLDHIQELKTKCDYVIVLYHGGKEHYRYPSPNLQKVCRKIVEKGADIVICQHSHCIGSFENYKNSTIVYGQGNFIFNKYDNQFWNSSLLIKINIEDILMVEYIPIIKSDNGVRLAEGKKAEMILTSFQERSNEILQDGFIENKYHEFAAENIQSYLRKFSGYGKWLSRIDRKLLNSSLIKKKYKKNELLALQNYLECEAHRELVLAGLKLKEK